MGQCRLYWETRDFFYTNWRLARFGYANYERTAPDYSFKTLPGAPLLWFGCDRLDRAEPAGTDALKPELNNLDAVAYENLLLGLFTIEEQKPDVVSSQKRGGVTLGFSRDGFHWDRPAREMAAIPAAGLDPTAWNHRGTQSVGGGCLVVGDRLYFYVGGLGASEWSTGLAFLRRDGFAAMEAGDTEGSLTTRPVTFDGKGLFVNVDDPNGELRAEVLDKDGRVIKRFSRENSDVVRADKTLQALNWKGAKDLSGLIGKPVRFRFHLKRGSLYAFWVSPDESGASLGYVAAGGPGFTGPRDTVGTAAYRAAEAFSDQVR
jgi:hypothetical protein